MCCTQPACCDVLFFCLFVSVAQLAEARDKTLECLNQTVAYKELKGTDPSSAELVKRIEQVTPHYKELMCSLTSICYPTLIRGVYLIILRHVLQVFFFFFYGKTV